MKRIIGSLTIAGTLALAGCASRADLDVIQRDNEELKTRLFRLEKDLGGVKADAKESIASTLKEMQAEREGARKGLADTQAAVDALRVDLQVLAGKIDDTAIATKKPADDIALLREDLERRLTTLDERIGKIEKGMEGVQQKMAENDAAKSAEKATPEGLYQKGLDAYRAGKHAAARESFTAFLTQTPKHELAANARYWTGETYYSEKNYEQAILGFQEVIKNFPGKEKVPAAMFKQAAAFTEIGDAKSARYVLKKLVEEHPDSEEAKRARERLKELK